MTQLDSTARVAGWLRDAARVTVLTGAGISTDSGIPDFRGPQGVWTRDPSAAALSSIDSYLADPEVRVRAWRARVASPVWRATPNPAHHALVALERSGRLDILATQNIDGLHQTAGSAPDRVLELHGSVHQVTCLACDHRTPTREVLARVTGGESDPACRACGGIQKTATVSFGQQLDPEVLGRARAASAGCDLFLAVGTSLSVYPAAGLCDDALATGARLVVVNAEPTGYDHRADAVLRAPVGALLPRLVADL